MRRSMLVMRSMRGKLGLLACLGLAAACGSYGPTALAERPATWVDNAWTQPVPLWGSPVRLNLPVPLSSIDLTASTGGLGAFGAHEGGHVEGLNHVWIPTAPGTVVRSWAAGTVTVVDDRGPIGPSAHEYFITVDYGQGLVGKHLDVTLPLVKAGDKVKEGDPIANGTSAEIM